MTYAIFTSESAAVAFEAAVCAAMGWPDQGTERYAIPLKHPTQELWSVPVTDYAAPHLPAGVEVVEQIGADWFPPSSMP